MSSVLTPPDSGTKFSQLFKESFEVLTERQTFLQWLADQPVTKYFSVATANPTASLDANHRCGCMLYEYFKDHLKTPPSKDHQLSVGAGMQLTHGTEYSLEFVCFLPDWCEQVVQVFDNKAGCGLSPGVLIDKRAFVIAIEEYWGVNLPEPTPAPVVSEGAD